MENFKNISLITKDKQFYLDWNSKKITKEQ